MKLNAMDWGLVEDRAARFTGRARLFERLRQLLAGPSGTFVITDAPGVGKSAVAARIVQPRPASSTKVTRQWPRGP